MRRFFSSVLAVVAVMCWVVATERQARAYVDPGSGLLVIQSAAAAVGSVAYFFRRKLRSLFGGADKTADVAPAAKEEKAGTQRAA